MGIRTVNEGTSTAAQRRAIVLAGKTRGLDVDALRALTPNGSIRALSFEDASMLLDRLNQPTLVDEDPRPAGRRKPSAGRGNGRRSAPGVYKMLTPRQREVIASYCRRLGWGPDRLDELTLKLFGLPMRRVGSRRDASVLITVLRRIVDHVEAKRQGEGVAGG